MNVADKELDESPDEALILKAVSLRRSFSIGSAEVSVLRGLSLDIKRNEKLFLRGASGAGKSTLLYTLAGLERPDSGTVIIDGKSSGTPTNSSVKKWTLSNLRSKSKIN